MMGLPIKPSEMPWELDDFCLEIQHAVELFQFLPDKYAGSDGLFVGKDFSSLTDIMTLVGIPKVKKYRKVVLDFLMVYINHSVKSRLEEFRRKRKQAENKAKRSRGKR